MSAAGDGVRRVGWANWTPTEALSLALEPGHRYEAACVAAFRYLGKGPGACLVVGSAPAEALALQAAGWTVTLVDVRPLPVLTGIVMQQADALALPFASAAFDVVSSTCVLCHAGLGRYGDPEGADGDRRMLGELARVVRPGGRLAVMAGPVSKRALTIGTTHRVYSPASFLGLLPFDLRVDDLRYFRPVTGAWLDRGDAVSQDPYAPDYLWAGLSRSR